MEEGKARAHITLCICVYMCKCVHVHAYWSYVCMLAHVLVGACEVERFLGAYLPFAGVQALRGEHSVGAVGIFAVTD